jgi:hypothetical protein
MDMDFTGARGSFSFKPKGKPGPEGIHGNLKVEVKAEINVPIDFTDKYFSGHLTGAQPSSVFWKELDPGNPQTDAVPRYLAMKRMELEVSADRRYAFKIKAPPPEGWDDSVAWRGAEVTLMPCEMKKAVLSMATNGALATLTFALEHQAPNLLASLADLVVLEEVVVDGWLVDRDLPLDAKDDPDDSHDGDEDFDEDEKDEEFPE